jgi:hypothetical protein
MQHQVLFHDSFPHTVKEICTTFSIFIQGSTHRIMKHALTVRSAVSFCGLVFDSATPTAYCVRIFVVMNREGFERKLL